MHEIQSMTSQCPVNSQRESVRPLGRQILDCLTVCASDLQKPREYGNRSFSCMLSIYIKPHHGLLIAKSPEYAQ